MKGTENKTINLDIREYDTNIETIVDIFTHIAQREGWTHLEIKEVVEKALCLQDYEHFIETLSSHCLLRKEHVNSYTLLKNLSKLGYHNHYLMTKAIATWDDYDYSNYRTLKRKVGLPEKVFTIVRSEISDNKIPRPIARPLFLFYSLEEAQDEIHLICTQTGHEPSEYDILALWRIPE